MYLLETRFLPEIMAMNNWQRVFSHELGYKAQLVRSVLEESGLNPVLLSKKDSSYNNFGLFEIYVSPDHVLKAIRIINDNLDIK